MSKPRSKLTAAERQWAIQEGEYWDAHSVGEIWQQTQEAHFDIDLERQCFLVALEPNIARGLARVSQRKGVSPQTLLNLWLQERLADSSK